MPSAYGAEAAGEGQGDTQPLNLSAVNKHADPGDKAEAGGE